MKLPLVQTWTCVVGGLPLTPLVQQHQLRPCSDIPLLRPPRQPSVPPSRPSKPRMAALLAGFQALPVGCYWIRGPFINGVGSAGLRWAGPPSCPPAWRVTTSPAFQIKFLTSSAVFAACFHITPAKMDVCLYCKTRLSGRRDSFGLTSCSK